MKRKLQTGIVAITLAAALGGCSIGDGFKKTFGLTANPPDAFQVGTEPPLSLPPELGQLPPPNPGEPRPQQADAAQQGLDTLSPASSITASQASDSQGQQAFLQEAGPTPAPTIRADVNQTSLVASKPAGFVDNLMGKGPTPDPTVDASAENRRLQDNAALGEPLTTGTTPVNSNEKPGLFDRFLNLF